jgi:iron complex transport system substrate-binding protein
MKIDDITGTIIDLSVKLHKDLGPGLLESVYESILEKEL